MTAPKRFATQRPDDPDCINAQAVRDAHWNLFGQFAEPGHEVEDFDATVTRLRTATGFQPGFVRKAVLAHAQLQRLPRLRTLQANTRVMDIAHLIAVNSGLEELGAEVEPEVLELFDELLERTFTPKRNNQELPQTSAVTRRIRDLIRQVDPGRAYDPKARKRREDEADSFTSTHFMDGGRERYLTQLNTDTARGELIHASVLAAARTHGTSMVDAAAMLLTGEISPGAVVMHIYTPKDRQPGDPVYIPGQGWTDPESTATVEEWLERGDVKTLDLDAAAEHQVSGYAPTPAMRAFASARDGTCIYPSCSRRADRCQLDHRIPYDEGGATAAHNLFSLCAHHHNMKTDRRVFYVPDPVTGDIVWLFADGTYTIVEPDGLLHQQVTPTAPRWQSSLGCVRRLRANIAAFNAKCHAVMDRYDQDKDASAALDRITELEKEHGLTFTLKPELEEEICSFDDNPAGMMSFDEKIRQLGYDDFAEGMRALGKLYGFPVWESEDDDDAV